ncbi:MAG: hypothetical protein PVF58_06380 [Candidatus Methanofastidiosia archaeon]
MKRYLKVKEFSTVPEHIDAINFILKLESVWNYFKTCIIAESKDYWIIDGRIYKKEVTV